MTRSTFKTTSNVKRPCVAWRSHDYSCSGSSLMLTRKNRLANSERPVPQSLPSRITTHRNIPAFLNKLYCMVDDPTTNDIIRWSPDGLSFLVEHQEKFAATILPRFYNHNKFTSFVRQLNMYDFHKLPHLQQGALINDSQEEVWKFLHVYFQRGRMDLMALITRKRSREDRGADSRSMSLTAIQNDVKAIQNHQSSLDKKIQLLHQENKVLWQEALESKKKIQRHEEVMGKVLRFLHAAFACSGTVSSMVSFSNDGCPLIKENLFSNDKQSQDDMTVPSNHSLQDNRGKSQTYSFDTMGQSAQSIMRDMDHLQYNVEALGNELGLDTENLAEEFSRQRFSPSPLDHHPFYASSDQSVQMTSSSVGYSRRSSFHQVDQQSPPVTHLQYDMFNKPSLDKRGANPMQAYPPRYARVVKQDTQDPQQLVPSDVPSHRPAQHNLYGMQYK